MLTDPLENKTEWRAGKKKYWRPAFSPNDVSLLWWTLSELLSVCLPVCLFHLSRHLGLGRADRERGRERRRGGGGVGGWHTWDEMMSTWDGSDVSLWTALATCGRRWIFQTKNQTCTSPHLCTRKNVKDYKSQHQNQCLWMSLTLEKKYISYRVFSQKWSFWQVLSNRKDSRNPSGCHTHQIMRDDKKLYTD